MNPRRLHLSHLLAPATGAAYVALWWLGEAGRLQNDALVATVTLAPVVLAGAAVALSRRWQAAALVLIGATIVLQVCVGGARFTATSWPAYLPLLYALFNISAYGRPVVHRIALPAALVSSATAALLLTLPGIGDGGWPVVYSVTSTPPAAAVPTVPRIGDLDIIAAIVSVGILSIVLAAGAWCAGWAVRLVAQTRVTRRHARELEVELGAATEELVALSERELLARDVHDVMAHSLAVIAAQADGSRMLDDTPSTRTSQTLSAISDTARDGLIELRRLLDDVPEDRAQPTLADLPTLLDRVRAAGVETDLAQFGEAAALTAMQELSVFRIIQEAVTNALRHARRDGTTTIALDWRGPGLAVLIATPTADATEPSPGRGIRGMQKRAQIAGGWLTTGVDDGAFIVNAFIPADTNAPRETES